MHELVDVRLSALEDGGGVQQLGVGARSAEQRSYRGAHCQKEALSSIEYMAFRILCDSCNKCVNMIVEHYTQYSQDRRRGRWPGAGGSVTRWVARTPVSAPPRIGV